jgi:hypothetical protein
MVQLSSLENCKPKKSPGMPGLFYFGQDFSPAGITKT